jgi:hypothetical protein
MTKISMDKRYMTLDERPVRIYAIDGGGSMPVHGAYQASMNGWLITDWSAVGKFTMRGGMHPLDLVEIDT